MATNVLSWSGTKMNFRESIEALEEHVAGGIYVNEHDYRIPKKKTPYTLAWG